MVFCCTSGQPQDTLFPRPPSEDKHQITAKQQKSKARILTDSPKAKELEVVHFAKVNKAAKKSKNMRITKIL